MTSQTAHEVPNPFKELRLESDISMYELARRAGVSKHAVLRCEQGMYPDPLPKLINYFTENYTISKVELLQKYEAFQVMTRANNGHLLGSLANCLWEWTPSVGHPLVWLRTLSGLNPTELAKRLCISQTVVVYFETRPINQQTVPEQLLLALKDAGYNDMELGLFKDAYAQYRTHVKQARATTPTPVGTGSDDAA